MRFLELSGGLGVRVWPLATHVSSSEVDEVGHDHSDHGVNGAVVAVDTPMTVGKLNHAKALVCPPKFFKKN